MERPFAVCNQRIWKALRDNLYNDRFVNIYGTFGIHKKISSIA